MAMPNKRQQDRSKVFMAFFFWHFASVHAFPFKAHHVLFCGCQVLWFEVCFKFFVIGALCFEFWGRMLRSFDLYIVWRVFVTSSLVLSLHIKEALLFYIKEALFCSVSNKCCCEPLNCCMCMLLQHVACVCYCGLWCADMSCYMLMWFLLWNVACTNH
jgi:hypothetical protein